MSLIDRLGGIAPSPIPEDFAKIEVLYFWAMLYELTQGLFTKAEIVARFNLDAQEETELDWLIQRYNDQPNATAKAKFVELVRVIFLLAEARVPGYVTNAAIVARLNAI